jgi:hypothetical protein
MTARPSTTAIERGAARPLRSVPRSAHGDLRAARDRRQPVRPRHPEAARPKIGEWKVDFSAYTEAKDGLAHLERSHVDVVLVDYRLERSTGSRCSTTSEDGFEGAVILLTGQGDERLAAEAMRSGARRLHAEVGPDDGEPARARSTTPSTGVASSSR